MRPTLAALVAAITCVGHAPAPADDNWSSFRFEAYNREYVDVRSSAEWIQGGPIAVKVSSPSHRLVIRDHSVDLRPLGGGQFDARVQVSFSGEGELLADLGLVGAGTRLEDHVVAPLQEVEVQARVRFTRVEEGYEIETIELPDSVNVEIESRLGKQLVDVCDQTLAIIGVHCSALDSMFSNAPIPLPEPGGTYFMSEDQIERAERRRLNRFLDRNR